MKRGENAHATKIEERKGGGGCPFHREFRFSLFYFLVFFGGVLDFAFDWGAVIGARKGIETPPKEEQA